ncbi:MAG: four helix bundle protein [bacterium]|nr:four helix bundle protein [bacterium]
MQSNGYRDLIVWQKAIDLVVLIYGLTKDFPREEVYGLVSQMKRAAVSISSNIAEGNRRASIKDRKHFLVIAFGSTAELETQVEVAKRLEFGKKEKYGEIDPLLDEVARMLNKMSSMD